jgi:N-acetylglucosaminyl-diphospho-decaprenol L-rhamnosyltransferase
MPLQDNAVDQGKVTVSVVSHRQAALVVRLLADLMNHCSESIEKVVLTCNVPETLALDTRDCPFPIEIVLNKTPFGFGTNHNQAFRRCSSNWFLVINPDVRLTSDVISALLRRSTKTTGLMAPQEMSESGSLVNNLRGPITPWELVQRQVLKQPPPPPSRGGWVKGMFMLARTEAFHSVGGFDERYFMYCEDFDICARFLSHGWTIDHYVDIQVTHTWQRQSRVSVPHLKQHLVSLWRMWTSKPYWNYLRHATRYSPVITEKSSRRQQ